MDGSEEFSMEAIFKQWTAWVALFLEGSAVVVIAFGGVQALWGIVRSIPGPACQAGSRKGIWLAFGMWLILGIEFELAADIVRTVVTPAWHEIGQLAAIAVIRTFLNFFLERDLERYMNPTTPERGPALAERAPQASQTSGKTGLKGG